MDGWLASITSWFVTLFTDVFTALVSWVHDAVLWALDGFLSALAAIITAIPVPSFMTTSSIGSLMTGLPSFAQYVLSNLNLAAPLATISAAVVFRLTRKLFTLGQW